MQSYQPMPQCKLHFYCIPPALVILCHLQYLLIIANSFIPFLFVYHYFRNCWIWNRNIHKSIIRLHWGTNTDNLPGKWAASNLRELKSTSSQTHANNRNWMRRIIANPQERPSDTGFQTAHGELPANRNIHASPRSDSGVFERTTGAPSGHHAEASARVLTGGARQPSCTEPVRTRRLLGALPGTRALVWLSLCCWYQVFSWSDLQGRDRC